MGLRDSIRTAPRLTGAQPRPRLSRLMAIIGIVSLLVALGAGALLFSSARAEPTSPPPGASTAPGPVANERYLWRPVAIGGGGYITGLDQRGTTMVARSDVYGAYRWDAANDRWASLVSSATMPATMADQPSTAGGVYEIAVAPGDPRRLYLAWRGRMFRSIDSGAHFVEPNAGAPFPIDWDANSAFRFAGPFLAVSPANADIVYLGTPAAGLWRSADGGTHWAHIDTVPPAQPIIQGPAEARSPGNAIWFVPDGSGRVFVSAAGHGLFVSDAGSMRFSRAADEAGPSTIWRGAFDATRDFYAIDRFARQLWVLRGRHWTQLSGKAGLEAAEFAGLAIEPHTDRMLATDSGGRAWCSTDKGESWVSIDHSRAAGAADPPWLGFAGGNYFASGQIMFDTAKSGRLWVAAGTGPFVADLAPGCGGTLDWHSQARGIEDLVAEDVIQPPGHAPLFAALDFGIHLKRDLGAFSTTFGPKVRSLIAAQKLDWSPSNPAFVVTNASDTRQDCCSEDGNAVLAGYSEDGGVSWHKFASLPQPPGTDASDPWRMAYGTIAVAANTTDNIVWLPANDRAPFYTLDRGATWRRVAFAGEHGPLTGSFASKWLPRRTLAADRVLPGTFYLYHSGTAGNPGLAGLWRTHDGGRSWANVHPGSLAPRDQFAAKLRAVTGHAGHLFFTSSVVDAADTSLRRSVDGGVTWSVVAGIDRVDDIAFGKAAPGAAYPAIVIGGRVGGRYGIWRSLDNAAHWQMIATLPYGSLDQINVIEADKDVFGRVYIGFSGSGWVYGEPAPCVAGAGDSGGYRCHAVGPSLP